MTKNTFLLLWTFLFSTEIVFASSAAGDSFTLKPEDSSHKSGSVYYTANKKDEVLFKASIWGSVQYPGVHYLPLGTRFLEAISIAGGPLDSADLEKIRLSSRTEGDVAVKNLSINKALSDIQFNPILKADDIIVLSEDKSLQRTSLMLQVGTFILSVAAFGLLMDQHSKTK